MPRLTLRNLPRVPAYAAGLVRDAIAERHDRRRPTYAEGAPAWGAPLITTPLSARVPSRDHEALAQTMALHLDGWVDLLGSGWVQTRHGVAREGLLGTRYGPPPPVEADAEGRWLADRVTAPNLAYAQQVWQTLDGPHVPIDWHTDVKSGYRWPEPVWYRRVPIGHTPGADIKVPWELGRMQHLPRLALAYGLARRGVSGFADPEVYRRGFCNHVLDFIAQNPPRFGVHWRCAMEVGIRVANWILTYDAFLAEGAAFSQPFDDCFRASVYAHGQHIVSNLEWWTEASRNNHFLANLAGLAFAGARLGAAPETDAWLHLAAHHLDTEVPRQFNGEGSNIESSVYYHAFGAELVGWTAAVLGEVPEARKALCRADARHHLPRQAARVLPPEKEAVWETVGRHRSRFAGMAAFLRDVERPDGALIQIGDNDSGRLFKLSVRYLKTTAATVQRQYGHLTDYDALPAGGTYWDEDVLSYSAPRILIEEMIGGADMERLVQAVIADARPSGAVLPGPPRAACSEADWIRWRDLIEALPQSHRATWSWKRGGTASASPLEWAAYPAFGVYVGRAEGVFVSVRCGPDGHRALGAHAHRDQFALELTLDGDDRVRDPGTGLYTASKDLRDRYRSAAAHHALRPAGVEPPFHSYSFSDPAWPLGTCLYVGARGFIGRLRVPGGVLYRMISVTSDGVRVVDAGEHVRPAPLDFDRPVVPFSPGYGKWL